MLEKRCENDTQEGVRIPSANISSTSSDLFLSNFYVSIKNISQKVLRQSRSTAPFDNDFFTKRATFQRSKGCGSKIFQGASPQTPLFAHLACIWSQQTDYEFRSDLPGDWASSKEDCFFRGGSHGPNLNITPISPKFFRYSLRASCKRKRAKLKHFIFQKFRCPAPSLSCQTGPTTLPEDNCIFLF